MADDKSGSWGSSVVVLAFAAVSAAYMAWQQPTLVSSRPSDAEYQGHAIRAEQDVDARLWQDPFDAVARNIEAGPDRTPRPGNQYLSGKREDLAIAVTLPGGPYPEIAETRRRLRYAVLAALHTRQFMPEDEKHIGYFRTDKPPFSAEKQYRGVGIFVDDEFRAANDIDGSPSVAIGQMIGESAAPPDPTGKTEDKLADARLPKTIPFEQFENISGELRPRVLLLWLDEDFLTATQRPIASLTRLHQVLEQKGFHRFTVLGPEDSTMLAAMAGELARQQGAAACLDGFSIYNFGATADEKSILKSAGAQGTRLKTLFCAAGARYYPTINSDGDLAEAIACELMRRDSHLGLYYDKQQCREIPVGSGPRDHVVLISDWDTVYGNDLSDTVRKRFSKERKIDRNWIRQASYLRGLDGRLPNRRRAGQEAAPTNGEDSKQKSAEQAGEKPSSVATPENATQFESAEGQSQFDYLRRLAADLKARDAEFRRNNEGHIGAIGVLGSDVYDKLLILQALRPEFPDVNFFTTDLDALLLPDKKSHFTRNLLVGSSYGLKLNSSVQCDIPPFRNSYQTSIFAATARAIYDELPALRRAETICKTNAAINSGSIGPLLFQIGRTSPQALPTTPVDTAPAKVEPLDIGLVQVSLSTRFAVFVIPLLLILCAFIPARVRQVSLAGIGPADQNWYFRWSGRIIAGLVSLAVLALWARLTIGWWSAALWLTERGLGEPISVFEGISIWPTIALRAVGFLLVLFLIWYAVHALETNRRETRKRFNEWSGGEGFFDIWDHLKNGNFGWVAIQGALWSRRLTQSEINQQAGDSRDEKPFIEIVNGLSSCWIIRCVRAGVATLVMFSILKVILGPLSDGPMFVPARGNVATHIFRSVTYFDFFATLFLTFLVADATIYSRSFIMRLTVISTMWNDRIIKQYGLRFHLVNEYDLRDWIDLQYLTQRTRCITNLVYFPFVAWAILIFSRSRLFDDFSMPWPLVIVYVAMLSIVTAAVIAYRATAEKARRFACTHLANRIIAARGRSADATATQLEKLLADMQELREGAFAPWTSQPIVKAVLLPLLTYGGTWLLHLYALPGM